MSKLKGGYSPSKSEAYLLTLLLVVGIAALSFNYLILPQWTALGESRQRQQTQAALVDRLRAEYARLDEYRKEEETIAQELSALEAALPGYFSEEELLTTVNTRSAENALSLPAIAFGGVRAQSREEFLSSLRPGQEGAAEAGGGDRIQSERIMLNYSGSYEALKGFLMGLEGETRKVFFRGLSVARGADGVLSGTVDLLAFSAAREGDGTGDYPGYPYGAAAPAGKGDPFAPFASAPQGGGAANPAETRNPDFYVVLNTYDDNASKILMGKYPSSGVQLTSEANGEVQAALTLTRSGNGYRYTYSLSGRTRSGDLTLEEGQSELLVSVLSRDRKGSTDKVGMTLSVKNETDLPVLVRVSNDDGNSPRFKLGTVSGSVRTAD